MQQRTLAQKVACTGLGLHSGAPVHLTLHPARVDSGIRIWRRGSGDDAPARLRPDLVTSTSYATTLGGEDWSVSTVEHLLAALAAFTITNLTIEVDGPEIPVMDGSAGPFVHLIRSAGVIEQHEHQAWLEVRRAVEVREGRSWIVVEPARHLSIHYAVEFEHPSIGRQELRIPRVDAASFEAELARARTFGFLREVRALRRAGLARGGSLDNTVLLDSDSILNPGGLRWPDEFVRHKALDLLGDLALLGVPIRGRVRAERAGHRLHHALVARLLATPTSWRARGGEIDHLDALPKPRAGLAGTLGASVGS